MSDVETRLDDEHQAEDDRELEEAERQPCGESGCICYGVGEEHDDCACGCDCPRCDLCRQAPEDCECED